MSYLSSYPVGLKRSQRHNDRGIIHVGTTAEASCL
jgi:hypothetical protein